MAFHGHHLPEDSHEMFKLYCSEKSCLKKIKILTVAVVTGALRVNYCASVVSNKMDNLGHHSYPLPLSQGVNIQGDPGIHGGPTMTW